MTLTTPEIYKLLPKTNCKECRANSCFAFAALVFKGDREIDECPYVDKKSIALVKKNNSQHNSIETEQDKLLKSLKDQVAGIDLESRAIPTGGTFSNNRLTLKVMGKNVAIDTSGKIFTDIHVNAWIAAPFMDYVINAKGTLPTGVWSPFRELPGGKDRYRLFEQRCEGSLKHLADTYPDLFEDLMVLFNGQQVHDHYQSDISLVLHPLPLVPILICYWKPDEGMASDLNLFFDETVEDNLNIQQVYTLGAGLVTMFEKIAVRHGISTTCPVH
ncbi:conserved hypothetical protein [Desulforapulum autotrophicum HRM2]|uniref:4Fe-4S domain-containing protein n=1 Tax=Desulforapulum autotrophicum (strain ATCC 43914 / DSM 3382 / VKM B-1955 / HRM2) TaxID=177437 RepID=C0QJC9_DESAH|nr:DUF3786 domain-containing protein [Desulforapulum autotrophicum]ACN15942.1 conserved hypothetical protein [Desulforapulum autotrophicum HRM2]